MRFIGGVYYENTKRNAIFQLSLKRGVLFSILLTYTVSLSLSLSFL